MNIAAVGEDIIEDVDEAEVVEGDAAEVEDQTTTTSLTASTSAIFIVTTKIGKGPNYQGK